MDILRYMQEQEERKRREQARLFGRPMPVSPLPDEPVIPNPYRAPEPQGTPIAPQTSPQSAGAVPPQPSATPTQARPTQDPFRSALSIPKDVQRRANVDAFLAQLSNAAGGLGRSGRNYRADPYAAQKARSAVIGDYVNRQQADIANRQRQQQLDLAQRKQAIAEQPKPVDPIERALKVAQLRKSVAEGSLKEREVGQAGTAEDRKQELVEMINTAMGKTVASMSMDEKTLNDMASDIGLDPLKLRRAKAAGGVRSTPGGISRARHPEAAQAQVKGMIADARYIRDPNKRAAYEYLVQADNLSPSEGRALERSEKEIDQTKKQLHDEYNTWHDKTFNEPEHEISAFLSEIKNLKATIQKYPNATAWNKFSSTLENIGDWGKWLNDAIANLASATPEEREANTQVLKAIRRYGEKYARAASGAAIGQTEWTNFSRQLGTGAFSDIATLKNGVNTSEQVLYNAIYDTWSTLDPLIQSDANYYTRVQQYFPGRARRNKAGQTVGERSNDAFNRALKQDK